MLNSEDHLSVEVDVAGTIFRVPKQELILCPWSSPPSTVASPSTAASASALPDAPSIARSSSIVVSERAAYAVHDDPNAQLVDRSEAPLGCVRLSGDSSVVRAVARGYVFVCVCEGVDMNGSMGVKALVVVVRCERFSEAF